MDLQNKMRLTQNKIEEILVNLLGEEGRSLIRYLGGRENVSEFDLANKTKKDIKLIRKMLYILYNHNLVGFTRKKDKQKGWYIYYWTLLPANIEFSYFKQRREQLEKLKQRLDEEHKELFFVCPDKCVRLNFDRGMDFEFHCPECGKLMIQDTNKEEIKKSIQAEMDEINEELKTLNEKRFVRRKSNREKKKAVKQRKIIKKKAAKSIIKSSTVKTKKNKDEKKLSPIKLLKKTAKKITKQLTSINKTKKSKNK